MEQVHATSIDINGKGVLIRGPSASGKSDLALRLIDAGARLVADDRTDLAVRDGLVFASSPTALTGRIEVRGIGILIVGAVPESPLALIIDLVSPEKVERLPEPATVDILGIAVALLRLAPFEASAPAKVRAALQYTVELY
ncbi:MAG: HPr kinase/phosphatase C-terminal domain-containing protein [Proteobacteria bacterium]|nr:HPr kinase/phosphatase C-terminal domain-containing protein [Pseudomonadota bacterium]